MDCLKIWEGKPNLKGKKPNEELRMNRTNAKKKKKNNWVIAGRRF